MLVFFANLNFMECLEYYLGILHLVWFSALLFSFNSERPLQAVLDGEITQDCRDIVGFIKAPFLILLFSYCILMIFLVMLLMLFVLII